MFPSHKHSLLGAYFKMTVCQLTIPTLSHRKFIQMSFKHFGTGPHSRNAQVVVNQCVHILYALRCVFLIHCLDRIHHSQVDEPERLSLQFLNSHVSSCFASIQDIKRPAKQCIPEHFGNNVEWVGQGHTVLRVHTGPQGLGRVEVSHAIIKSVYQGLLVAIRQLMRKLGVPTMTESEFDSLRDGLSCLSPGQGLGVFNVKEWAVNFVRNNSEAAFRTNFINKASNIYRLSMAAIHICGGPAPRGTEEAVTRLLNSDTELMRNVLLMNGTIGVQNGYVHV